MKSVKTIGSNSGLCNRIRLLSSARHVFSGRIRMLWPVNSACPAFWDDIFHPVGDVSFVRLSGNVSRVSRIGAPSFGDITLCDLLPKVEPVRLEFEYTAVHVRRTDLVGLQKRRGSHVKSDMEYVDEVEAFGLDAVFLATDNEKTQGFFKRHFKNRLVVAQDVTGFGSNYRPVRCTSMSHAVTDLYTCFYATNFVPTFHSSFSGLIVYSRQRRDNQKNLQEI